MTTTTTATPRALRLQTGLTFPAAFVADMLAQSGLTRDQLRWGCILGLRWKMTTSAELAAWASEGDVLSLTECLAFVGAGDVDTAQDFRDLLASE